MKQIVCLLVVAALSGCAPSHSRPGTSSGLSPETQAYWDAFWECEYEARAATAQISDDIEARSKQQRLADLCMKARGYDY